MAAALWRRRQRRWQQLALTRRGIPHRVEMLRQQVQVLRAARLGLGVTPWAAGGCLPVSAALVGEQWRSYSSQAAPAESGEGPALPPFDYQPPAWTGPSKEEVLRLRKAHLNPGARDLGDRHWLG